MKAFSIIFCASLFLLPAPPLAAHPADSISLANWIAALEEDLHLSSARFEEKRQVLRHQLQATNKLLQAASLPQEPTQAQISLLIKKMDLQEQLQILSKIYEVDLSKKRYKKGVELIKMLYEKLLALDHHFSSLNTYQNVMSLSNPNTYPTFQKTRELLERRLKKDNKITVPSLLNANPYISTTFSLVASLIGNGNNKDRESELEEISCILDFTATMNSDLATVFYETEFLKESNNTLKEDCLNLFTEYSKVIGYYTTLDKCRKEDDWERLFETLDVFAKQMEEDLKQDASPGSRSYKSQVNLEFAVDRLLDFINKYNAFISQGEKYYKKFKIIVSSYPNEAKCLDKLPPQFSQLQKDIDNSIYKFNEAYNISELTGSKLKDLLYGFTD